ncbi:MAG: hypothetical protein ACREID_01720, partial [Planctomycetota bacterium]
MSFTGWRLLLFALFGAALIVFLATMGVPRKEEALVDRYSGEQVLVVRNVADALAEARATGDATEALAKIRARLRQFPSEPALLRAEAMLAAELAGADEPH